jgi:hypothetical protein
MSFRRSSGVTSLHRFQHSSADCSALAPTTDRPTNSDAAEVLAIARQTCRSLGLDPVEADDVAQLVALKRRGLGLRPRSRQARLTASLRRMPAHLATAAAPPFNIFRPDRAYRCWTPLKSANQYHRTNFAARARPAHMVRRLPGPRFGCLPPGPVQSRFLLWFGTGLGPGSVPIGSELAPRQQPVRDSVWPVEQTRRHARTPPEAQV